MGIHPTDGGEATLTNILLGKQTVGDIYLKRYKTSDIPKDEEGAQTFLMDVYKEKDDLLGHYKESGGQKFTDQKIDVIKVKNINHNIVNIFHIILKIVRLCDTVVIRFSYISDSKKNWSIVKHRDMESDYMHTYNMEACFDAYFWKNN